MVSLPNTDQTPLSACYPNRATVVVLVSLRQRNIVCCAYLTTYNAPLVLILGASFNAINEHLVY